MRQPTPSQTAQDPKRPRPDPVTRSPAPLKKTAAPKAKAAMHPIPRRGRLRMPDKVLRHSLLCRLAKPTQQPMLTLHQMLVSCCIPMRKPPRQLIRTRLTSCWSKGRKPLRILLRSRTMTKTQVTQRWLWQAWLSPPKMGHQNLPTPTFLQAHQRNQFPPNIRKPAKTPDRQTLRHLLKLRPWRFRQLPEVTPDRRLYVRQTKTRVSVPLLLVKPHL